MSYVDSPMMPSAMPGMYGDYAGRAVSGMMSAPPLPPLSTGGSGGRRYLLLIIIVVLALVVGYLAYRAVRPRRTTGIFTPQITNVPDCEEREDLHEFQHLLNLAKRPNVALHLRNLLQTLLAPDAGAARPTVNGRGSAGTSLPDPDPWAGGEGDDMPPPIVSSAVYK